MPRATRTREHLLSALIGLLVALLAAGPALAGPRGERVVKGRVKVRRDGDRTRIKASDGSIVRWKSFDIDAGEKVRIVQPGKDARILNRVSDSAPTRIDGTLVSNGQVYVVNSAGVYLGGRAVVDVGRLVAAGGALSDRDFRAGVDRFRALRGDVENLGRVEADSVALVGRRVANHGQLLTRDGDVALVAGDDVFLGDPERHVLIRVDGGAAEVDGPAVENTGLIDAGRGRARLAAGDALALALRDSSVVRARRIEIESGKGGETRVSGTLDASDAEAGGRGGGIDVLGDRVVLEAARLDASGDAGGGRVRIGGDVQGSGELRRSRSTDLDADTRVTADALRKGHGGQVIVWSDGTTRTDAEISARGGARGGDGGFVETSGLVDLDLSKAARVSSPRGRSGTWLIDPTNIRIVDDASATNAQNLDGSEGVGRDPAIVQSDRAEAAISSSVIVDALSEGTSVIVTTDTFDKEGPRVGDIRVESPIVVSSPTAGAARLTMFAANDLIVTQDIGVASGVEFRLGLDLIANDNRRMPLSQTLRGGQLDFIQPELNQSTKGLVGNRQTELGNFVLDSGVSIDTGGGDLQIQGRNVKLRSGSAVRTGGGTAIVIAENPVSGKKKKTQGTGLLKFEGLFDTDGGGAFLESKGHLSVTAPLDFLDVDGEGAGVTLSGRVHEIDADILVGTGGIQIGRDDSTLAATRTTAIGSGALVRSGDTIILTGGDVSIDGVLDAGEGDINMTATSLSVATGDQAVLTALQGEVLIDLDENVVAEGELDMLADERVRIRAAQDLTAAVDDPDFPNRKDAGSIEILDGQSEIRADEIVLRAGDGPTANRDEIAAEDPDDPRINGRVVVADGVTIEGGFDPDNPPTRFARPSVFRLVQDATFDDAVQSLAFLPNPDPGETSPPEITIDSADGSVSLTDPVSEGKFVGSELKLRSVTTPNIGIDLRPVDLTVKAEGTLDVGPTLAARLLPENQLELHAGSEAEGDLTIGQSGAAADTVLSGDTVILRAGDATAGTTTSAVHIVQDTAAVVIQNAAGDDHPAAFTLRQDASIADADVAPRSVFLVDPSAGDPLDYTLRSDDGSISLVEQATRAELAGLDLSIFALDGISLTPAAPVPPPTPFDVYSLDIGGVGAFDVTQALLDGFDFLVPAQSRLTLRSGLGVSGSLSFDTSASVQVQAEEIRLAAVADDEGRGGGRVVIKPGGGGAKPLFLDPTGSAPPTTFVLEQDAALSEDDLPGPSRFGGTLPTSLAFRSNSGSFDLTDLSLVPDVPGGLLVVSAPTVTVSVVTPDGDPVEDLDFATLTGQMVIQADTVTLAAAQEDPVDDAASTVDASSQVYFTGYDEDAPFAVDADAAVGLQLADVFDPASPDATSPLTFTLRQEAQWTPDLLPLSSAFESGLADTNQVDANGDDAFAVDYGIASTRGGITLVDAFAPADPQSVYSKLRGANLGLQVEPKPKGSSVAPGADRTITFDSDGVFLFEAVDAVARRAFTVDDVSIDAIQQVRLQGGVNGKDGQDLILLGDVSLTAERIRLRAGDGGASGSGDAPPKVDASGANLTLTFVGDDTLDGESKTLLSFRQDAPIQDSDLPTVAPGANADEVRVTSDEGSITLSRLDQVTAREVTLSAAAEGLGRNSIVEISSPADGQTPDFSAPGLDSFTIRAARARFSEQDAGSSWRLGGTALQLEGQGGAGTRPIVLSVTQVDPIVDPDVMVEGSQLGDAITGAKVRFVSTGGDVVVVRDLADRVVDTDLRLRAENDVVLAMQPDGAQTNLELLGLQARATTGLIRLDSERPARQDGGRSTVTTLGAQVYQSPVQVERATRLIGALVEFQDDVNGLGAGRDKLAVKAQGRARFFGDLGATTPLWKMRLELAKQKEGEPAIRFGVDDGGPGAGILVRTRDDLQIVRNNEGSPRVAVVAGRDSLSLESLNGAVRLRENVKLAVDGDLSLSSQATEAVVETADLAVAGRLAIDADRWRIHRRSGSRLIRSDGASVKDSGTNVLANELALDVARIRLLDSQDGPLIGLPDPLTPLPRALSGRDGEPRYPVAAIHRDFGPLTGDDLRLASAPARWLLPRPEGPSRADLAADLPIDPPGTRQPMPEDWVVSRPETLLEVGVDVRTPTRREWKERLGGAAVYDDVGDLGLPAVVASPRLLADSAHDAVELYTGLFGANGENAPRIRSILGKALDDFRRDTRARRVIGFEFRRYVKNRPSSQFAAHQTLEELDRLFHRHRNSGLAPAEYRRIQAVWLEGICPEGISPSELSEAIHPSRYVRGSDILDIFGD